jgi:hypothetical protein
MVEDSPSPNPKYLKALNFRLVMQAQKQSYSNKTEPNYDFCIIRILKSTEHPLISILLIDRRRTDRLV